MSCQIKYDKNGNVSRVNAPNGKESILYQNLKNTLGNSNDALKAWARVYTDSFKQWFGNWNNSISIKPGVEELFESNPELANAVYSKILTNSGLSAENLLSLLLKDNLIEKQCS